MNILPSAGTTSRLASSRAEIRQDQNSRVELVRRRLRFAPGGLEESEVNRRCGWPVGAGAILRGMAECGEATLGPDRRWRLGAAPQPQPSEACNRAATIPVGPVLGSAPPARSTPDAPLRRPTDADGPLFHRSAARMDPAPRVLRDRDRAPDRAVGDVGPSVGRIAQRGLGRPKRGEQSMMAQLIGLIGPAGATRADLVRLSGLEPSQVSEMLRRAKHARRVRRDETHRWLREPE